MQEASYETLQVYSWVEKMGVVWHMSTEYSCKNSSDNWQLMGHNINMLMGIVAGVILSQGGL